MPGNANYANIVKKRKKTCLIGGSIINRIDISEFNRHVRRGVAIKRPFSGAVASQVYYYVDEVLEEEELDRIIINVGTNNLSKKRQTAEETAMEIIEIVEKCHDHGINEIFVSGITCRPQYQEQILKINKILKDNAGGYYYTFIDNSDIVERHLWKDNLHLNKQGTINLACNFLDSLNKFSLDGQTIYDDNFY